MYKVSSSLASTKYMVTQKSSFVFFMAISVATMVRPFLIELPLVITYVGVFNSVFTGFVFCLLKYAKPKVLYVHLFLVSGVICITPLLLITGGVNSQFSVLIPLLPIIACLVASSRVGIIASLVVTLLIIILRMIDPFIAALDEFQHDPNLLNARTFWLLMGVSLALFFSLQFNRLSNNLSEKLALQANMDVLTGLLNRRCILDIFETKLSASKQNNEYLSVLMLDVDHFKRLNDQYGHIFGDKCLKVVANTVKQCIRQDIDFVGRYGGEEFLVLLHNVDAEKTSDIAEKIRYEISTVSSTEAEINVEFTVTIGCCSMKASDIKCPENIIEKADAALYKGKNQSRNCVVVA